MSRVIPIALAAHMAERAQTVARCLKVTRADGFVLGLTETNGRLVIDSVTYYPGFSPSDWVTSAGLDVENQEVTVLPGTQLLTQVELAAGLWDNAAFEIFEVNHRDLTMGVTESRRGTTGEAHFARGMWTIEFRGLKQALQQPWGKVTSKTCRARLGDSLCTIDLTPFTFACTVTAVASVAAFTDSARTQADEYFVEGSVTFLTGSNAGYARKVKVFSAGVFTVTQAFPFVINPGDTFTAIAGCQKRHERSTANPGGISDCVDKFNNILNFQGEPHIEGVDALTALPAGQ